MLKLICSVIATVLIVGSVIIAVTTSHKNSPMPCDYEACSTNPTTGRPGHVYVYSTDDGDQAYRGVDGFWYWWILSDPGAPSSGQWVVRSYSPQSAGKTIAREEEETTDELQAETSGNPLPDAPQAEEDLNETAPESEATPSETAPSEVTPSETPSTPEAAPSDSGSDSSSDSGGGGGSC